MKRFKEFCTHDAARALASSVAISGALCCIYPAQALGDSRMAPQEVQQVQKITGNVVDETGEPMIGVTVRLKGTQTATVTDIDGNFVLACPKTGGQIELSYIGYQTMTVKAVSGQMAKLTMKPDNTGLDEVVVIGYGTQKKRDLTGAIASVKSEDITLTPATNPMQALQGRVSGLDITRESGQAGSGVNIQLRGNRSLPQKNDKGVYEYKNTAPLFIIDGMPGDYSTLNPNDIESIEVLKDASSTAIYGSSGANGVILITTKGGKEGKLSVNLNAYYGINSWAETPKMRMGETYVEGLRQAYRNAGNYVDDETMFQSRPAYYQAYLAGKNIDWVDNILHTGTIQNYSLSLSGGTDKIKSYVSFNFSDEQGQYNDDNYKVYSTNIRVDNKVNSWLSAGMAVQGSYVHRNKPFAKIEDAYRAIPFGDIYDEEGNIAKYPIPDDPAYINLLVNNKSNYRNQDQNAKLYVNPYIRVMPFKGFTWESRLNATLTYSKTNKFEGAGAYNFIKNGEDVNTATSASITQNRSYGYKWENILTYNFTLAKDHQFTVTGVTSWEDRTYENSEMWGTGITNNAYLWHNLDKAVSKGNSSSYSMSKGMGYIGRINYSYMGRYLASVSVRHDGASRLADGNKWDTFPAFALGWRISDEKFMESTRDWLDNLKLRVGYGETGSTANIGAYSSTSKIEQGFLTLGGERLQTYAYSENVANPLLTWERSKNWNIGLDASFLNGRIDVVLDYYNTKTEGVIWDKQIPVTCGAYVYNKQYSTFVNLAETKNQGFEAAINTRNIISKDFKWTSTLTFSYNKEEITKLSGTTNDRVTQDDRAFEIGSAINSWYHFKLDGIWQKGEEADAACFGSQPGSFKINVPGMERHEDAGGSVYYTKVDADGVEHTYNAETPYAVSAADYQVLGHMSPDWSLGFQNSLKYKDFDLSVYMYMRWGQMIKYNMLTSYDPTGVNNYPEYFNVWSENNPSNDFPAMNSTISDKLAYYPGFAAMAYVDGSFFKIKNITLGYTLPNKILNKIGLTNLRVYGTITNPLIISKSHLLKDYDPEMNGSMNYPLTKQLVFGLNVSF